MNEGFRHVCEIDLAFLVEAVREGRTGNIGVQRVFGVPEDFKRQQKLLDRFLKTSPWREHVGRYEVMTEVDLIVRQLAEQPDLDLRGRLEAWEQSVLNMDLRLEILLVQGLAVFDQPLSLGRVKFWHLKEKRIEGLVRFTVKSGGLSPALVKELKANLIQQLSGLRDLTVAIYQARGSALKTRQDALVEVRRVLPVLRALTMLDHNNPMNVDIAVSGDARSIWHDGFALTQRGGGYEQHPEGGNWFAFSEALYVDRMHQWNDPLNADRGARHVAPVSP